MSKCLDHEFVSTKFVSLTFQMNILYFFIGLRFGFFLLLFQFCSDPEGCLMKILTRLPASSPKLHVHNFPGRQKSAALSGKQLMHNRRWKIKKNTMLGIKQYQRANITQSVPLSSWAGVYIIGIAPELTFIHTLIALRVHKN